MSDSSSTKALKAEIAELKRELEKACLYEERLSALTDASFEGLVFINEKFEIVEVNKAAQRLCGFTRDEMVGMQALDFIAPESKDAALTAMKNQLSISYEAAVIRKDGTIFLAQLQGANIVYKGKPTRITAVRDITQEKQNQQDLERAHAELESIFTCSMVGFILLRGGRNVYRANQRIADILGYETADELIGKSVSEFHLSQKNFEKFGRIFFEALMSRDLSQIEYQFRRKDGSPVWCAPSGKAIDTNTPPDLTKGVLWIADDITERKKVENRLMEMATTDPLTGIWNRRHFMNTSEREFIRQSRYNHGLSLLMLDIDHFKRINDTFGHDAGDTALKKFTEICLSCLRSVDIFGRLGGEEFAAILPDTDEGQAVLVAERIRQAMEQTTQIHKSKPLSMTVSIGVAMSKNKNDSLETLLIRADDALYKAKDLGRNCVELNT